MEADWSVEIGADLPVIAVPWEGFIDLRHAPSLASGLEEAATAPALARALVTLNAAISPVFTAKCDLWLLTPDDIDPLEFGASREQAQQGIACYVDVVARDARVFASFAAHEAWVRATIAELREIELPRAHVEYVVRASSVDDHEGFAVTLYTAACAVTEADVKSIFHDALETATAITIRQATKRASSSIG